MTGPTSEPPEPTSEPTSEPPAPAGGSWLDRLSPVPKLAWLTAVVCVAFATYHPIPLLVVSAIGLAVALGAGLGRPVASALLILVPLAASIVVVQSTTPGICGACTPAATVGPLTIYQEGLARAVSLIARVLAMEIVAVIVFATTRPSDLVAALVRLRVPYVLAFMLAMTLQLVPVIRREVGLVLAAQQARGMRRTGFGALVPTFVPVFSGTIDRMQLLAVSLESRGFGASGPRTSFRRVRYGALDRVLVLAAVVAGVAGVAAGLTVWGADRVPVPSVPAGVATAAFVASALAFAGVVVAGARAIARL
jgi:energy-coupling factor transport system permease protein